MSLTLVLHPSHPSHIQCLCFHEVPSLCVGSPCAAAPYAGVHPPALLQSPETASVNIMSELVHKILVTSSKKNDMELKGDGTDEKHVHESKCFRKRYKLSDVGM